MSGGILDVTADAYHADTLTDVPTFSASTAHVLLSQSPLHAWSNHPRLNENYERQDEQRFDVGNVCHALLLEDSTEKLCVVPYDNWKLKAAQELRDEARELGQIPLLAKQWDEVLAMTSAVRVQLVAHGAAPALFMAGEPEKALLWQEDGVWCRARVDWLRDDLTACDDLKTTSRTANPETWCRTTLYSIGADIQCALYGRGIRALTGADPVFRFCVAETTAPYALSVISLAPSALELANAKVDRALAIWKECLATDRWPSYPNQVCYAEAPGWELARWMEREGREEIAA